MRNRCKVGGYRRRLLSAVASLADTPIDGDKRSRSDPEQRPASVLFADLSGFAALAGELSDEVVPVMLDRFLRTATRLRAADAGVVELGRQKACCAYRDCIRGGYRWSSRQRLYCLRFAIFCNGLVAGLT